MSQLDPMALLTLRATGSCTFEVPEEWFDLDGPGYYLRRIRSAALSIPCVTGPYTSINCRVVLTKSLVRMDPVVQGELLPDQLVERKGAVTEMVASSAQGRPRCLRRRRATTGPCPSSSPGRSARGR